MNIYFFTNFNKKIHTKDVKGHIFREAFCEYIKDKNIELKEDAKDVEIIRSKRGKPFFNNKKIHFSISHSENIWVCVFSKNEVGIDVQFKKSLDYIRFSKKYFTKEEIDFLANLDNEENIKDNFYKMWTGKEAIVKFKDESIFSDIKKYNLVENGKIKKYIKAENIIISEIFIDENFQCCLAYGSDEINGEISLFELEKKLQKSHCL